MVSERPTRLVAVLAWTAAGLAWTVAGASALWARHPGSALFLGIFPVFVTVGALVWSRRPRHRVAWLLLGIGIVGVVAASSQGYAALAATGGRDLPAADVAAWLGGDFLWAVIWALFVVLLLVLPDGRPLGRATAWLMRIVTATTVVTVAFLAGVSWPYRHEMLAVGPAEMEAAMPAAYEAAVGGFVVLMLAMPLAAAAIVVRFRRSRGVERQQMKWIAFAAAPLVLLATEPLLRDFFNVSSPTLALLAKSSTLGIPVTIGFAVLRYRLYEIDRIWNRAVVYTLVVAILAATYAGFVIGMQSLLQPFMRTSDLSVAASTLAVAALFGPVRRRVQAVVDRRFNRSRYDAARTIEAFGQRIRDEVDVEALVTDFHGAVVATMNPASVSMWLPRQAAHGQRPA